MVNAATPAAMVSARECAMLHVCSLPAMPKLLARIKATHLVTVVNDQLIPPTPEGIHAANHLKIACNDIIEPEEGLVCPSVAHIDALVAFGLAWRHAGPLIVHCWAGISRSTAAAFIMLCALNPVVPEQRIAALVRRASPTATPNRLMVRLGDAALERGGRMVAAIAGIGAGEPAMEAVPFALDSRLD